MLNRYSLAIMVSLTLMSFQSFAVVAIGNHDGEVLTKRDKSQLAWDEQKQEWVSLEQFWHNVAERKGGLTYGQTSEYPDYDQVSEHDTLLIELPQGTCLMEFFHQRWRRANDVWRWDDAFNQHSACPYVFD